MIYKVYRNKNSDDGYFNILREMYKRIISENKHLCLNVQNSMGSGVFVNGEMHPTIEQAGSNTCTFVKMSRSINFPTFIEKHLEFDLLDTKKKSVSSSVSLFKRA